MTASSCVNFNSQNFCDRKIRHQFSSFISDVFTPDDNTYTSFQTSLKKKENKELIIKNHNETHSERKMLELKNKKTELISYQKYITYNIDKDNNEGVLNVATVDELKQELNNVKVELKEDFKEAKKDLKDEIILLRNSIEQLNTSFTKMTNTMSQISATVEHHNKEINEKPSNDNVEILVNKTIQQFQDSRKSDRKWFVTTAVACSGSIIAILLKFLL